MRNVSIVMDPYSINFYGHCILMQNHGFKCIAKEADLTCELLRRGASYEYDYLLNQSSEIRMCALSLMNCNSSHSVAASAAMLVCACLQNPT